MCRKVEPGIYALLTNSTPEKMLVVLLVGGGSSALAGKQLEAYNGTGISH